MGEFVLNLCRSACESTCRCSLVSSQGHCVILGLGISNPTGLPDLLRLFEEALIQMSI